MTFLTFVPRLQYRTISDLNLAILAIPEPNLACSTPLVVQIGPVTSHLPASAYLQSTQRPFLQCFLLILLDRLTVYFDLDGLIVPAAALHLDSTPLPASTIRTSALVSVSGFHYPLRFTTTPLGFALIT